MTTILSFDIKGTRVKAEQVKLGMDFARELATGEAITQGGITITLKKGTDATPSARLPGSPVVSGTIVLGLFDFTEAPVTYCLEFRATTDQGQVLRQKAHVTVDDSC